MPLTQKRARKVEPSLRSKYFESLWDIITGLAQGQRWSLHSECAKLVFGQGSIKGG